MSPWRSVALALFVCLAGAVALAQTPPATSTPSASTATTNTPATSSSETTILRAPGDTPFRAGVSEVIVPVTVTDLQDRFVDDLDKDDFKLFDENVPQTITFFSRDRKQPVVVGFLVDMSNRNVIHWKTLREAVVELILNLLPPDKPQYAGYLIPYSTTAELAVDTTNEAGQLVERLEELKPGGGSALYDAIYMACTRRSLMRGEPIEPRRVLIIVGDGVDTASTHGLEEVLELAQRNLVTIYGVSTQAYGFTSDGNNNLVRLANETGGRVEYPLEGVYKNVTGYLSKPQDAGNFALVVGTGGYATQIAQSLFESVTAIVGEINTQYIMRYVPSNTDSPRVFRRVRVEVNLPNVKIRTRSGYYPYNP